jgi:TRAP-type mannitol/chloroaromatic compound transport system permease small subunit
VANDDAERPAVSGSGGPDDVVHRELDATLTEVESGPDVEFQIVDAPLWLRPLLVYQRAADWLTERVGALPKYLAVAVIVVGFVNALLRYIGRFAGMQLTSNRYIELQWYLYAALFLLAFAYILKHGINVRVDFWFADRSERTKAWIDFVGNLIGLLPFCLLGLWLVWPQVLRSFGRSPNGTWRTYAVWEIWEQSPDPGGLPRAPVKALLFIGLGLLLLQAFAEMIKLITVLTGHGRFTDRNVHGGPTRVE